MPSTLLFPREDRTPVDHGEVMRALLEKAARSSPTLLTRLADLAETKLKRRFLEAIDGLADYTQSDMLRALANRNIAAATALLNQTRFGGLFQAFTRELAALALRAVTATVGTLANAPKEGARKPIVFDPRSVNPRVVQWVANHSGELIVEITQGTRQAIRQVLTTGIQAGNNPRVIARNLRPLIGLTERQTLALTRYRERLEARGEPGIDRKVARMATKALNRRAETIARDQSMTAANIAQDFVFEAAVQEGKLPSTIKEQWLTALGERVCPICRPMHKQTVPFGGVFTTGDGRRIRRPPAHVSCRCVKKILL